MSDLEGIKVGDLVCIQGGRDGSVSYSKPVAVEKVTKTQVIAFGEKWRIKDGRSVGADRYSFRYITRYSGDIAEIMLKRSKVRIAENACEVAARKLASAKGDEAIRLAAILPPQLEEASE